MNFRRLTLLLLLVLIHLGPRGAWAAPDTPTDSDDANAIQIPTPEQKPATGLVTTAEVSIRYEKDLDSPVKADRLRYRARLGWQYKTKDEAWTYVLHLRSGSPFFQNSAWTTIDKNQVDGFWPDEAYIRYTPPSARGLELEAGEFPRPWHTNPVYSGAIWSNLMKAGGVNVAYNDPDQRYWVSFGPWFAMPQDVDQVGDFHVLALHTGLGWGDLKKQRLELSMGVMAFDYDQSGLADLLGRNRGNSVIMVDKKPVGFGSNYDIVDPKLDYYFHDGKIPFAASVEYFQNVGETAAGVAVNGKSGYSIGVVGGRAEYPGHISARLQYLRVGQDAVFSPMSQGDFVQGTNFDGFYFNVTIPVTPHLSTALVLEKTDQSAVNPAQNRTAIDLYYQL